MKYVIFFIFSFPPVLLSFRVSSIIDEPVCDFPAFFRPSKNYLFLMGGDPPSEILRDFRREEQSDD